MLDPILLHTLLEYLPETGQFFWKNRCASLFSSPHQAKAWNNKFAGKEAFTSLDGKGYKHGDIFNKRVYPHQLAVVMTYGSYETSSYAVDHINGDRVDNRIVNLRLVSYRENALNCKRPRHNTSGHVGVTWHKQASKWMAQVQFEGKCYYLGLFDDISLALDARNKKQKELGFHENHGRD